MLAVVLAAGQGSARLAAEPDRQAAPQPNAVPGTAVQAPAPCLACQILSVRAAEVDLLPARLTGLRVAIRVPPGAPVPASAVAEVRRRGGVPVLHVTGVPGLDDALLTAGADAFVMEATSPDLDALAFDLKRALTTVRGQHASVRLVVAATSQIADALRARGLAAYLDAFVAPPVPLGTAEDLLTPIADETVVRLLPEDVGSAALIVGAASVAVDWFPAGLARVSDRLLQCGEGRRIPAFLNAQTLDLVGVSGSCPAPAQVTSDIVGVIAERLDIGAVSAFRVRAGTSDRFAEGVTVGGARALTVEEIVARHQAFAARQVAAVSSEIATGTLTLTFEAPGFVAPVTITSKTEIFRDAGGVDLRQIDIRVNGVAFAPKDGVPHLPIIEPERVATVPLAITLTGVYRYALDGRETIDGRPCYRVEFAPQQAGALFSGRAWIDAETFAMARVAAVQTGLKGPIVASEQTDTFAADTAGRWLLTRSDIRQTYEGASVRTPIHRLLEIERHDVNPPDFAARKRAAYASTDVILRDTPSGFRYLKREAKPGAESRQPVVGSAKPEPGTRNPEAGTGQPAAGSRQPAATTDSDLEALRSIAPAVTRIRTFAAGVIVDPNISTPLPFAGLSYVDFDLFHTGTQFSGFYGGSYGQLAFSAPSLGGTRWQLAGRAFGIATSYNDRDFVEGREIYTHDIRQRPAQVAVWTLRPIAARAALRFEYDWDYNKYARGDETDPAFVVPASQNAHTVRAGLDLQYAGWQTSVWASQSVRIGWHEWGVPAPHEEMPTRDSFQRLGASVLRTGSLSPHFATRIEASAVTGRNMDRFSRIAFGTFDNRLHGYPSALVRYDRGAVVRTALSWTAMKAIRVDGFADTAAVHDPAFGRGLRNYTGFGAALEAPAPFRTLLALEWGYGVQGVNTDGTRGTNVVRITGYKVF